MNNVSVDEEEAQSSQSHYKERGVFMKEPPDGSSEPGPAPTQDECHKLRAASPVPSCVSLKSDESRNLPPLFSNEPGAPQSRLDQRAASPVSSCESLKSDESRNLPPVFSNEPGALQSRLESPGDGPSSCGLCQSVLTDPVSTSCGHCFCRQCLSSNWDQSGSAQPCPQCGQRLHIHSSLQSWGLHTPGRISPRVIRQRFSTRFLCSHPSYFR